jgi:molybdate transport system regulatory protein
MEVKLHPRSNFWLETDEGLVALSEWRIQLLESVGEAGSISGASRRMNIPYRLAWQRIREMEERLGVPLVVAHTGGSGGGGANLTKEAEDLIRRFEKFRNGLEDVVKSHFEAAFRGSE